MATDESGARGADSGGATIVTDPALPPTAVPAETRENEAKWTLPKILLWAAIALLGGVAWVMLAIVRGETVNAVWFVFAAVCTYLIAYRFYSKVIQKFITRPDDRRATPAEYKNDGKDYTPTDRRVLFGHHFAAIAGAGPLVGPVLAAQMGYTCPEPSGSSSAWCSPAPCRTTSCCSSRCDAVVAPSARWPSRSSVASAERRRSSPRC